MNARQQRLALMALVAAGWAGAAAGKNAQALNARVADYRPAEGLARVEFDLSWEGSWRDKINHDACWVFVKFSNDDGANWRHGLLGGTGLNPPGFAPGTGAPLEILVPDDRVGAFVRRSKDGRGAVSNRQVQLVWNYGAANLKDTAQVKAQVMAIEMVYVAQGPFYLGDGATNRAFMAGKAGSGKPFLVGKEDIEITLGGGGEGSLGNGRATVKTVGWADDYDDLTPQALPSAFPKGFAAFYCMKYELSQGHYADFLNTLIPAQAFDRYPASHGMVSYAPWARGMPAKGLAKPWGPGYMITTNGQGGYELQHPAWRQRGCNYLSWIDGLAYADWAGLRPMTELEFEKACRGPLKPVKGEYAWGATNIVLQTGFWGDMDAGAEVAVPTNANYNYGKWRFVFPGGPIRGGLYADTAEKTGAQPTREATGASYWGAYELSGSLDEGIISTGHAITRRFTGKHGDGELSEDGEADVEDWPHTRARLSFTTPVAPEFISGTDTRGLNYKPDFGGKSGTGYRGYTTVSSRDGACGNQHDNRMFSIHYRWSTTGWRFVRRSPD